MIEADAWRHDRWGRNMAGFTANLMNLWSKKTVRPRDLWRSRSWSAGAATLSRAERQRRFEEAVRLMGPQAIPVRPRRES